MKLKQIILFCSIGLLITNNAFAFVNCQSKYDSDKRSLPSKRGNCSVCHINPAGGGPQNEFGIAFKQNGFMLTDELVAKFPNLFQKPIPSSGGNQVQQPSPRIKRIKPNKVKINVQSMVSITGKNFVSGAKAFIDGSEVLTTFKSNVKLVIDFILNTVGIHEIKVQNPDGQESEAVKIKAK